MDMVDREEKDSLSESSLFGSYCASGGFKNSLKVIQILENASMEAWLVGGCVRDAVLGRRINDIDIACWGRWEMVEKACLDAGLRVRRSGIKHGTVSVIVGTKDGETDAFEVTTYRIDSKNSADGRHPDHVEFTDSIEEDLARRDFTMNAMAWHPRRGILDPFGGIDDIEDGIIRVVGEPESRFKEDALRIFRGCRFASELGFSIEDNTLINMRSCKHLVLNISDERITYELDRLLMGDHVHHAIMDLWDVLSIRVPELVSMRGYEQKTKYHVYDVLEHTAWAVKHSKKTLRIRWAAFCHDMGKPSCGFFDEDGVSHFYGHAKAGERIARGLLDRMSHKKSFRDDVCMLVANHNDVIHPTEKCVRKRLAKLDGRCDLFEDLLELKRADMAAHAPNYANDGQMQDVWNIFRKVVETGQAFTLKDLKIDGNDIRSLGVDRGPMIGKILNALLEEVIEGRIENGRDALMDAGAELLAREE